MVKPISNSELQTWLTCPRKWGYEYVDSYRPAQTSEALNTGIAAHTILEQYYKTGQQSNSQGANETLDIMLDGYWEHLQETNPDRNFEILDVEGKLEATIEDVPFRGIYDLLVADTNTGETFLIDHKTGADFRLESYSRFNPQIRLYQTLSYLSDGPTVSGTWLNMMKRSKQTSRAKGPFYKRDFTPLIPEIVEKDIPRFAKWGRQILAAREETQQDAQMGQHCSFCPYQEPCFQQDLGEDVEDLLEFGYNKTDPNERYNT